MPLLVLASEHLLNFFFELRVVFEDFLSKGLSIDSFKEILQRSGEPFKYLVLESRSGVPGLSFLRRELVGVIVNIVTYCRNLS